MYIYISFPYSSDSKESVCNAGHLGSIPGLGRSLGEGKGYPVQYRGLENPMDCTVHGVLEHLHGQDSRLCAMRCGKERNAGSAPSVSSKVSSMMCGMTATTQPLWEMHRNCF